MLLTTVEIDLIASRCEGLQSIAHLYEELRDHCPACDDIALKNLFLWCIRELMQQGRLRFLGEGWVRDGIGPDAPLMFGDRIFSHPDVVIDGLRQPSDASPGGVVQLIGDKWPSDLRPAFNRNDRGFNPLWFEKWHFEWFDGKGNPVLF